MANYRVATRIGSEREQKPMDLNYMNQLQNFFLFHAEIQLTFEWHFPCLFHIPIHVGINIYYNFLSN